MEQWGRVCNKRLYNIHLLYSYGCLAKAEYTSGISGLRVHCIQWHLMYHMIYETLVSLVL